MIGNFFRSSTSPSTPSSSSRSPIEQVSASDSSASGLSTALLSLASLASPDPEDAPPPRSGSPNTVTPAGEERLQKLTERKLEKVALGKTIGLRQLVLLSNAFASRSTSGRATPTAYSQGQGFDDELLEDIEDERIRKKREEDWLDSVLDEMLTDEEDYDRGDAQGTDSVREPYVHLSIKDRRSAREEERHRFHPSAFQPQPNPFHEHYEHADEPALIPLPDSPSSSNRSSQSSQQSNSSASDDGRSAVSEEEGAESAEEELVRDDDDQGYSSTFIPPLAQVSGRATPPAPISIANSQQLMSISTLPFHSGGPATPELSHSFNSLLSTLSSSPPTSLHLLTPTSSPPTAFLHKELLDGDERENPISGYDENDAEVYASIFPMEGLDGEAESENDSTSSSSTRRRDSDLINRREGTLSGNSSLELVRYQPSFASPGKGLSAATSPAHIMKVPRLFPSLSPPLLNSLLKKPVVYTSAVSASRPGASAHGPALSAPASPSSRHFNPLRQKQIILPILIPYEVVKCVYDSVDFGTVSPTPHPSSSLVEKLAEAQRDETPPPRSVKRALSPPPSLFSAKSTVQSCPTSPRARSKSLSRLPDGIQYDSSGSLLFTSQGLQDRLLSACTAAARSSNSILSLVNPSSSFSSEAHEPLFSHEELGPYFPPVPSTSFGRGIVEEWERRRRSGRNHHPHARTDSRSPSRLRMNVPLPGTEGDFEFGSI